MIARSIINNIINLVIDNIEGGYYHPDMKTKLKGGDKMGISGETMFGIDRTNGAPFFTVTLTDAPQFWAVVDANFGTHHGDTSYYGDKADGNKKVAASVGNQLRKYVESMIIEAYGTYKKYLSKGALAIVENDPRLMLQFLYAVWNGPGNFQKFADLVNAAYANGNQSAQAYYNLVQDARRNRGGLFKIGADKLDVIAAQLPQSGGGGSWLWWLLGGLAIFGVVKLATKGGKK